MRRITRVALGAAAMTLGLLGPLSAIAHAGEEPATEEEGTAPEAEAEGGTVVEGGTPESREAAHHLEELMLENGAAHSDAECALLLGEGKTVEDCQAAPNPLLPETNEIIWGSIGFVIVFGFLAKVGTPQIKKTMAARTEQIRGDLESAEAAKADASRVLEEYRAQLADARSEASRIIEEARQQGDALRRDLEARAQTEAQAIRDRAAADADSAKAQAMADLRNDVAQLVSAGVDAVVTGGIDEAAKGRLVDQYIDSIGRSN